MVTAAGAPADAGWTGCWVASRLDVALRTTAAPAGVALEGLVGLALRRNPRRAHLLVSAVLGKHVPTDPRLVLGAGRLLGALVAQVLRGDSSSPVPPDAARALTGALTGAPGAAAALLTATSAHPGDPAVHCVVLGYAETATALSHAVADALGAAHLHSTRRSVAGSAALAGFEEEHSHATDHLLLPDDPSLLSGAPVLVLVDDELSTGRTVLNTLAALRAGAPASAPPQRCVVAALVDLRSPQDRAATEAAAHELGTRIDVVALASGEVALPPDVLQRGARLVAQHDPAQHDPPQHDPAPHDPASHEHPGRRPLPVPVVDLGAAGWPTGVRESARHGFTPRDAAALDGAVAAVADRLAAHLTGGSARMGPHRVLVLGHEELMYAPQRVAAALAGRLEPAGAVVRSSATTRSPVLAVDDAGYAVRTTLTFRAADSDGSAGTALPAGERYAHNVAPPAAAPDQRYDDAVVVVDDAVDPAALAAPDGLLAAVAAACGRVTLVTLPVRGPEPRPAVPSRSAERGVS